MARKKKKDQVPTYQELARTVRKDWNGINPVSRVVESKKNKKPKYKHKQYEEE